MEKIRGGQIKLSDGKIWEYSRRTKKWHEIEWNKTFKVWNKKP